nr:hypothetical protein [Tanacetum cinerariifolium]
MLHTRYRSMDDLRMYNRVHPERLRLRMKNVRPIVDDVMAVDWISNCATVLVLEISKPNIIYGLGPGGSSDDNKISWIAWDKTISPHDKGGLGIGSLKASNHALLAKWWWRFLTEDNALWSKAHGIHSSKAVTFKLKLQNLKFALKEWRASVHANDSETSAILSANLERLDNLAENGPLSYSDVVSRSNTVKELTHLEHLKLKDIRQKAKVRWALEGDENSSFFHGMLNNRRNRSRINGHNIQDLNLRCCINIAFLSDDVIACEGKAVGDDVFCHYWTLRKLLRSQSSSTHMLHTRYRSMDDLRMYNRVHPERLRLRMKNVRPIVDDVMAVDWISNCATVLVSRRSLDRR